jgi:hypothetical protein
VRPERGLINFSQPRRPYFGALKPAWSDPADSDFIGSVATVITWIYVHFRHSNERMSQPFDPGMIRAGIIPVVHLGHGGCSSRIFEDSQSVEWVSNMGATPSRSAVSKHRERYGDPDLGMCGFRHSGQYCSSSKNSLRCTRKVFYSRNTRLMRPDFRDVMARMILLG